VKRGPEPKADRLSPFDAIVAVAQANDKALNRAIGRTVLDCELIERFEQEVDLGGGMACKSNLVGNPHIDPVRLEMMWRRDATRSEIATHVLTKLFSYGRAIGFMNS